MAGKKNWIFLCCILVSTLVFLLVYSLAGKSTTAPYGVDETYMYRGLGITSDDRPIIGTRVYSYRLTIGEIIYRADRIAGDVFKFQIHSSESLLGEGITKQDDFGWRRTGELAYNLDSVINSRNYDLSGKIIAEVVDGYGTILLPVKPNNYKYCDRVSACFNIVKYGVSSMCFFDKTMADIDSDALERCSPYLR